MPFQLKAKKKSRKDLKEWIRSRNVSQITNLDPNLIEMADIEDVPATLTSPSSTPIPVQTPADPESTLKGFEYLSGKPVIISAEAMRRGELMIRQVIEQGDTLDDLGGDLEDNAGPEEDKTWLGSITPQVKEDKVILGDEDAGPSIKKPRLMMSEASGFAQQYVPPDPSQLFNVNVSQEVEECTNAFAVATDEDDDVTFY